ncbi:hypothetical protein [Leptospira perolatii]|uniref:hypothetical protein n=1 Tax=Leptospira perolatii TaxID=2023191 RepID=UPI001A9C6A17|nr:hypothetical protein [Leptospira perolatii]
MELDTKSILAAGVKGSATIFAYAIGFLALGFFLNLILLAFLIPEMSSLISNLGPLPIARAGGIGAIIALFVIMLYMWPVLLIILIFVLVFPGLYFIFGKKHGVSKALHSAINSNKGPITDYLSSKLGEKISSKMKSQDQNKQGSDRWKSLQEAVLKLEDVPNPLRFLLKSLLQKIRLADAVQKLAEKSKEGSSELSEAELKEILKNNIDQAIQENLFVPELNWLYILLSINFATFLFLKIWF